jgi:CRP/FNR family transcriptional regulator
MKIQFGAIIARIWAIRVLKDENKQNSVQCPMLDQTQYERIKQVLPILRSADATLIREFQQSTFFTRISAGKDVFIEGDDVDAIALLISGVVRVYKVSETGREITLYRFGLGESCILTANAILSQNSFPAIATVEQDAEAAMIPADVFRDWVRRYDLWRGFVFELLSQRLSSVMTIVEEVAFHRMDKRVAALLIDRSRKQHPIQITHHEIAAELGSSREVISRILEGFTSQDLLVSARGLIQIMDLKTLESIAVT